MEFEIPLSQEEARRHPLALRGEGKPVSATTFWRWLFRGVRGVKLESEMRGGRRVVFPSALERFNAALSSRPIPPKPAAINKQKTRQDRVRAAIGQKRPRQGVGA